MSLVAPSVANYIPPLFIESFTDLNGGGDIDLAALSGFPMFGPQQVLLHNGNAAAGVVALWLKDESQASPATFLVTLAPGETRSIEGPIAGVDADLTLATTTMIAYWRCVGSCKINA